MDEAVHHSRDVRSRSSHVDGVQVNGVRNGNVAPESPWRRATDPVSRQLLWELSRLALTDGLNFREGVDLIDEKRNQAYERALDDAAAKHEQVRRTAEAVREEYELQRQIEREMQLQAELRKVKEALKTKAAQERAAQEERLMLAQEAEAAERAATSMRQAHAAALEKARIEKQQVEQRHLQEAEEARKWSDEQAAQQAAQRLAAETEAKARAAVAIAARTAPPANSIPVSHNAQRPAATAAAPVNASTSATSLEREQEYQRYVQLHQKLKELRKFVTAEGKKGPDLKRVTGDSRRAIRKCVGQLTGDLKANKGRLLEIVNIMKESRRFATPEVPLSEFFYSPPPRSPDTKAPALMLYLLNIFAKSLIAQFIGETSVAPMTANALGIIGSSVFAQQEFQWEGRLSFIDFFLAKYHVVCPVLFGRYGPESTPAGKLRLGWRRTPDGAFIEPQRHAERMTGLGAGFAGMSLRNFNRSKLQAPLPPHHWWRAVADITNVPPGQATSTHLIVLKAMIENCEQRILEFFGDMGKAVLRRTLIQYPNRPEVKGSVPAKSLALLVDVLEREKRLFL